MSSIRQVQGCGKAETGEVKGFRLIFLLLFFCLSLNLFVFSLGYGADGGKMAGRISWPSVIMGWTWDQEDKIYDRETLFNYIDGAAEVFLAYNFQEASVHRYVKAGQPDIVAEVYQMGSSPDAFGVFSLEKQDPEVNIGQGSEFGGSLLRFWKGRTFVSILGEGTGKELEAAVLSLGHQLATLIQETGEPPRMLRYLSTLPSLPAYDRLCFVRSHVLLNRCFFISHQNLLQLDSEVQAVMARYAQGKDKVHLLVVRYPSEVRALSAFNSFRSAYLPEAGPSHAVRTEDGKWTKLERFQEFIIVVFGTQNQSDAENVCRSTVAKIKEEGS
jgi:hypothetical protein